MPQTNRRRPQFSMPRQTAVSRSSRCPDKPPSAAVLDAQTNRRQPQFSKPIALRAPGVTASNAGDLPTTCRRIGARPDAQHGDRRPAPQSTTGVLQPATHLKQHLAFQRLAEAKPMAPPRPMKPLVSVRAASGERAARGGKYDCLVTNAECARTPIPDAPLPPPSQETRFKAGGVSRFLCLLSLRRQRK